MPLLLVTSLVHMEITQWSQNNVEKNKKCQQLSFTARHLCAESDPSTAKTIFNQYICCERYFLMNSPINHYQQEALDLLPRK